MGLSGIFATALYRIDSTILAFMKDNTAVGLYGSGYRLLDSTLFISFFLVAAMFPALSRLDRTTTPTAGEAFELGSKALVAVLVPLGIVFTAYAQPIVDLLYGSEFLGAASVVRLLGGAAVFYGLAYLASWMLLAQNRERLLPWLIGGAALLNLALNFILIPPLSEDGAAIATTASEAAVAIAGIVLVVRGTGRVSARRILLGPVVASAGMAITAVALGATFPSLIAAGAVYAVLLVLSERRLYPEDVRGAVAAVLPRGGGQPSA
jgi:O-antigen/teichoic acid export membrane protein